MFAQDRTTDYWRMKNVCYGFSLPEIAAVLMVVGALLVGFMNGQALTDISQSKQLEDDFRNVPLYLNEYQGRFKILPGDDPKVGKHLSGGAVSCVAAADRCMPGNGIIDGRWNDNSAESESFLFWQHVRLAGLVPGDTDTTSAHYPPKNALGGALGITNRSHSPIVGMRGANVVCSDEITGNFVKQLDIALDDGNTADGSMMVTASGTVSGGLSIETSLINDGRRYLVCMGS